MPRRMPPSSSAGYPRGYRNRWVAGAAAGNITVTGIKATDTLLRVGGLLTIGAPLNLTAEFTITADNTINNVGGTSSAGGALLVEWVTPDAQIGTFAT